MKTHNQAQNNPPPPPTKLRTQIFSCGFFRNCTTRPLLSPTASPQAAPPLPSPPPPTSNDTSFPHKPQLPSTSTSSSSSSSASASQSFTQWKFPFPTPSPITHPDPDPNPADRPAPSVSDVREIYHSAEVKLSSGSESERLSGLQLLERTLVRDPPGEPECPPGVMRGLVGWGLRGGARKAAAKVLLALCLAEGNRRVAVEAGAVGAVVEAAAEGEMEGSAAERAMAALELMCTVPEGAAAVRAHALAVPVMVAAMGRASARERECAMSVLAVIYSSGGGAEVAPAEEVARAVELAMQQGECSARGRRKGLRLLKALEESHAQLQQHQLS